MKLVGLLAGLFFLFVRIFIPIWALLGTLLFCKKPLKSPKTLGFSGAQGLI